MKKNHKFLGVKYIFQVTCHGPTGRIVKLCCYGNTHLTLFFMNTEKGLFLSAPQWPISTDSTAITTCHRKKWLRTKFPQGKVVTVQNFQREKLPQDNVPPGKVATAKLATGKSYYIKSCNREKLSHKSHTAMTKFTSALYNNFFIQNCMH